MSDIFSTNDALIKNSWFANWMDIRACRTSEWWMYPGGIAICIVVAVGLPASRPSPTTAIVTRHRSISSPVHPLQPARPCSLSPVRSYTANKQVLLCAGFVRALLWNSYIDLRTKTFSSATTMAVRCVRPPAGPLASLWKLQHVRPDCCGRSNERQRIRSTQRYSIFWMCDIVLHLAVLDIP